MKTAAYIDKYLAEGKFPSSSLVSKLDPEKHYLGTLCHRGHEYENTGKSVRRTSHDNCMVCVRLHAFVWRTENIDLARANGRRYEATPRGKELSRKASKKWNDKDNSIFFKCTWGARQRCQKKNMPFNITPQYCESLFESQNRKCFWTGVPLITKGSNRHPLKASLDRITPCLGYVVGNIVIASNFSNRARSDTPFQEFKEIMEKVKGHLLSQP